MSPRDEWCREFIEELVKLRPQLSPEYGTSKIAWTLAGLYYAQGGEPTASARRHHADHPVKAPPR